MRHDFRILTADKILWVVALLLLVLIGAGIYNGAAWASARTNSVAEFEQKASERITVDQRVVQPSRVRVRAGKEGRSVLEVTLSEGRNRIVRRLFEQIDCRVNRLMRVRYGSLTLPRDLRQGKYRELTEQELAQLRASIDT